MELKFIVITLKDEDSQTPSSSSGLPASPSLHHLTGREVFNGS